MTFPSNSGRIRLSQVLITLAALGLMVVAFVFFRPPQDAIVAERAETMVPRVVVSEVGLQPFDLSVEVVGRVAPWREVSLASEVSGRVEKVHVDIGARVAAGDLLASIEADDYEIDFREAEATQLRAQARFEESAAALNRTETLRDRGAISEREYEAALSTKRAAEADLKNAEAGLERAQDNLDDTQIVAPFTGSIVERHVDPGALVAGDQALLVLADLDRIAVEVGLTENEIFFVRKATNAFVQSTNQSRFVANGHIDGITERADPSTGTYLVRIRVDNREEPRFLGGMVVNVEIPHTHLEAIPTVPAAAVLMPDQDPHVFIVRDQRALRVDLDIVAFQNGRAGVVSRGSTGGGSSGKDTGLQLGDSVVIVGQMQLVSGDEVLITSQQ